MTDIDRIRQHILNLNEAWRSGRFDALGDFYHPDVVLLPPDAGAPILGREAVVASYREFAEAAELYGFEVTALDIFPFDSVSACHMRFDIDYRVDRGRFHESGLEVYLVEHPTGSRTQPVIIWRSQAVLDVAEVLTETSPS